MKHLILSIFLLTALSLSVSAETIKGSVFNLAGEPIPFATISVLAQDSTLITGAITDEQGTYSMEVTAKNYILQASFVGYQTAFGGPDFVLREETEQLAEVQVKAKKPLIERQMDKLVVNVSASPLSAGSNGNDILRRAPGVRIDKDGNITVNGKSVEIWIDGKPSYLSGNQLKAMLDGTDGNTIEKIEIISNPSAKYDASGQGGIINIKTKRNMMKGLNGMLSAAYGGMYFGDIKRYLQMDMVSLNLNYRTAKTYTSGQLTQVYSDIDQELETSRTTPTLTNYSKSGFTGNFQYYMFKLGNDWYIDSLNTFGFILQVPYMRFNLNTPAERNFAYVTQGTDTIDRSTTLNRTRMANPQHTANLNFTHTFSEALERELTVNVDYNRYRTNQSNYQATDYTARSLALDINTRQVAQIYSAKLDFQTKFWQTGMIECGVKYGLSSTNNAMTTDSTLNNIQLPQVTSSFLYQEHVAAAYITAGKQFGEHWSVKLGLRGEYTYSHGDWTSADSVTNKSYFDPFPTAYIGYSHQPSDVSNQIASFSVSASYSRRIKRPNYYMLNPFVMNLDAYSSQVGNTELTPEYNNDVEVHFSWTQYLNMTFNFAHTQDMFSQKTFINPDGTAQLKWVNFGTCTTHGANISLTELPLVPKYAKAEDGSKAMQGAWLALTVNAGWLHFINRSYDKNADGTPVYENRSHYGYVSGTLSAYLPKDWTLTLDGNWSSPMTTGYERMGSMYYTGFGVRKMIMKHGLILNLNIQDMLRSMRFTSEEQAQEPGYASWYRNTMHQQKVIFSLTWMFGQQSYTKQRRVGNLDESSRLGSGASGVRTAN
ncbi:MAG: TonB-dependent receptor [Paludibacteraceae bacterium]|nr:TonB-dependent receptor [Paludibacteraceae bacterium]